MFSIRNEMDLHKLPLLKQKKNIMVRFVMNGCGACKQSQPMWNDATKLVSLKADNAMAEVESQFVDHFKDSMTGRQDFDVQGFPTILIIRGKKVAEHEGRDTNSIITALKQIQKRRQTKRTKRKK
jgi:hypothetical protein